MPRILDSLQVRDFRLFTAANLGFTAAVQMQVVAQGWLVFHLTGSTLALGIVGSMWSLSLLALSPVGGVVADRIDRRRLTAVTWLLTGLLYASVAALVITDRIEVWHLAAAAVLHGGLLAFNIPARFALVTQLVGEEKLLGAMGVGSVTFHFSGVVFPLVGGAIIDLVGAEGAYVAIALLFFLGAWMMRLIPAYPLSAPGQRRVWSELAAGLRYIRGRPALCWLLFLALVAVVLGQSYAVLLPKLAADLNAAATGLGLLFSMVAVGALTGNFVVANLDPRRPLGRWLFAMGVVAALGLVALALLRSYYPVLLSLFLLGLVGLPFFTLTEALIQLTTEPRMRGRVAGIYMLAWAGMPLGTLPLTAAVDRVGLGPPLIAAGAAMLAVMSLVAWRRPGLLRLPESAGPGGVGLKKASAPPRGPNPPAPNAASGDLGEARRR